MSVGEGWCFNQGGTKERVKVLTISCVFSTHTHSARILPHNTKSDEIIQQRQPRAVHLMLSHYKIESALCALLIHCISLALTGLKAQKTHNASRVWIFREKKKSRMHYHLSPSLALGHINSAWKFTETGFFPVLAWKMNIRQLVFVCRFLGWIQAIFSLRWQ